MAGITSKEIKNRIRSMESTRQITKAMDMVAAAKLRRAQTRIAASRPFFEALCSTMQDILRANRDFSSPYLKAPHGNRALYIVIAGDRGLAGSYNSNILKLVHSRMQGKDAVVLPIGKKSVDFFKSKHIPLFSEHCTEAADVSIGDCFTVAKQLCAAFLNEEFDQVHVAFTSFESVLSQVPTVVPLLPLRKPNGRHGNGIIYEGSSEDVFDAIVPDYLSGILYGALCESRASEQAARRSAMDSATRNADDMIEDLSLKFNRARQAAITQEITEIVAGS